MSSCCESCTSWVESIVSDVQKSWDDFKESPVKTVVKALEVAAIILVTGVCVVWSGPVWTIGGLVFGCFMPEMTQRVVQDITNVVKKSGWIVRIVAFLFAVIVLPLSTGFVSFLWAAHLISEEILSARETEDTNNLT